MISPETKAKLHELIKGTNLAESMIETAYEKGYMEGEERGIAKGQHYQFIVSVLISFDKGTDIDLIAKITQRTADEVRAILIEYDRIVEQ